MYAKNGLLKYHRTNVCDNGSKNRDKFGTHQFKGIARSHVHKKSQLPILMKKGTDIARGMFVSDPDFFCRENRCIRAEKRQNVMPFPRALHLQFVYIFFGCAHFTESDP